MSEDFKFNIDGCYDFVMINGLLTINNVLYEEDGCSETYALARAYNELKNERERNVRY